MNILAIDTSNSNLLVGLKTTAGQYCSSPVTTSKHLETLLPNVEELLEQAQMQPVNLDIVGVVVGPGSFTGIRIGVATAKAFMSCYKNLKCIAVNSLELLAYNTLSKSNSIGNVICVIPSTLRKYYVGVYRGKQALQPDKIMETAQLQELIQSTGYQVVAPSGVSLDFCDNLQNVSVDHQDLFDYIQRAIIDNKFVNINELKPYYLGLSQAELDLLKKEENNGSNI